MKKLTNLFTPEQLGQLTEEQLKTIALLQFHGEDIEDVDNIEDYDGEKDGYIVLTDDEADEMAKEYILDSVWAFTPSFLADFTGIDIEVFEAIQNNGRCESNNNAILSMIKSEKKFVNDAISADGRGHFMSSYDGEEHEENVNGQTFYIYRIN